MSPNHNATRAAAGVLLVNLGTPDDPSTPAVRRYLRQFLSDPRVVDLPRALWWLILNLVILVIRPARSARAYQAVWTDQGSPLMVFSQGLADAMQAQLGDVPLELAMSYGKPTIESGIEALARQGVSRVIVLPLYPQFSFTTTAAVYDAVDKVMRKRGHDLQIVRIADYFDDVDYITAQRDNIQAFWDQTGQRNKLLMSFHGLPANSVEKGDPYFGQCERTAQMLANALNLTNDDWVMCFQSRVGRQKWLQPYTEDVLEEMVESGVKHLDVVSPGFAVDCLETLEEIAMGYAEDFVEAGGEQMNYIPCLNDSTQHAALLTRLVRPWLDSTS